MQRYCFLTYDIPERPPVGCEPVENPSGFLRRRAVRVNLSVWVIPEDQIPHARLAGMIQNGCKCQVVKFDPSEAGNLVAMAEEALRTQIREAIQRAEASDARMVGLINAATGDERAELVRRYERQGPATVNRLRKLLDDLEAAAGRFGIDPSTLGHSGAIGAANALSMTMTARAMAFKQAADTVRAAGHVALADAMDRDEAAMPAFALADLLQEQASTDEEHAAAGRFTTLFGNLDD